MNTHATSGTARRNSRLHRSTAAPSAGGVSGCSASRAKTITSGPCCSVSSALIARTSAPPSRDSRIARQVCGEALSPTSRLLISAASRSATATSSRPIAMLPAASYTGLPETIVAITATRAKPRPTSAATSSLTTTSRSLRRVSRYQRANERPRRTRFACPSAVRSETPSAGRANAMIPIPYPWVAQSGMLAELVHALVDR